MAREPENMVLAVLREIREKQDEHSDRFERIETRIRRLQERLREVVKSARVHATVVPGLDPGIHHISKAMDYRVKPGNNDGVAR